MESWLEPDIPLVYLTLPGSFGRIAVIGPAAGESMGVLHKQVKALPGYVLLWRGKPASILEVRAKVWVMYQPNRIGFQLKQNGYMDYRYPQDPERGFGLAKRSFASAIAVLKQLAGHVPSEVLVVQLDTVPQ
ncbi:hypothetical protein [uncultured Hymenobacter sp.]|uniref:hypothetical protein n=1 Tax=uncultured Hymenobacter sp. TaxID=170016 RepID=UPI0035CB55A9